jgi:DNA gyrase subunit B
VQEAIVADEAKDLTDSYQVEEITVVSGLEHVRHRPGMYIGDIGQEGLHRILFQLAASSIKESVEGYGHSLRVALKVDGSVEVSDEGRGIAVPSKPTLGKPVLERLLTEIMTGPGRGGRDWLDYTIANALSEWFQIETRHDGEAFCQEYRRGEPVAPLRQVGACSGSGVKVTFKPDPAIFPDPRLSYGVIRDRLLQYAFLHSNLRVSVSEEATGEEERFEFEDGVRSLVQMLNRGQQPIHAEVLVVRGEEAGVEYEVALQWRQERDEITRSFVNDEETNLGGTHVAGMRDAVTRSINSFIRKRGKTDVRVLKGSEARRGLTGVVSVRMARPGFWGATKDRLVSPEAQTVIATGLGRFLRQLFASNSVVAEAIVRPATS